MSQILDLLGEELRVAEEEIRAQHELIEGPLRGRSAGQLASLRLTAALPIAVVETDSNGLVLQANSAAGALFRIETCQLRGKPLAAMVEPSDRRALRTALSRASAGAGPEHVCLLVAPLHDHAVPVTMAVLGDTPTVRFVIAPDGGAHPDADATLLSALGSASMLSAVDGDLSSTLSRLAMLAVAGIGPAVGASLTVGSPAEPAILVSTNGPAQARDGDQFRAAAGPSWDAFTTNVAVASATLHADERWPALGRRPAGAASGTDAVTAVPLPSPTGVAGVLTLYGAGAVADPGTARQAALFAGVATALLREHTAVARLRELEAQLRTALTTRPIIDQAKGIVMAQNGVDADSAFDALVARSQQTNVKVRDVARDLVTEMSDGSSRAPAGHSAPPPAPPGRNSHSTGSGRRALTSRAARRSR